MAVFKCWQKMSQHVKHHDPANTAAKWDLAVLYFIAII